LSQRCRSRVVTTTAAAAAVLGFAGAAGAQKSQPVRRDSAGVEIVENGKATSLPKWTLGARPSLDLGSVTGNPDQEFSKVAAALRLADGSICVVDEAPSLRLFSSDGQLKLNVGRKGRGPGEFILPRDAWLMPGDSILLFDVLARRLTVFTKEGEYARDFRLTPPSGSPGVTPKGLFGPHDLLAVGYFVGTVQRGSVTRNSTAPVVGFGMSGEDPRELVVVPSPESWHPPTSSRGGVAGSVPPVPFLRGTGVLTAGQFAVVAPYDTYELRLFDNTGRLRRIIRRAADPVRVTDADVKAFIDRESRRNPGSRAGLERVAREAPIPKTMPAYGQILSGAGNIWVEESRPASESDVMWTVFSVDGQAIATVLTPEDLEILDIGHHHVIGLWRDDLDVEHVRMYTLETS